MNPVKNGREWKKKRRSDAVMRIAGRKIVASTTAVWLQQTLDYARACIWSGSLAGDWRCSAKRHCPFGLAPKEFCRDFESFIRMVHPEDRDMVRTAFLSAARQGGDIGFEHRLVRSDGVECWIAQRGMAVRDVNDTPARLFGMAQDITSRKHAEETLTRGYAWMQMIQEASMLANSRLDYTGTFAPVMAALRRLVPVDHFMIVLEEDDDAVFVVVETDANDSPRIAPNTHVPFQGSFLQHLKEVGRTYVIHDLAGGGRFFPEDSLAMNSGLRSCARLPLYNAGAFIGALVLASRCQYAFDDSHLPYLESLAAQVAHTVANIQRYQQARGEAQRLTIIVREVHHRIKNNLQGVIGLLGRYREEQPALLPVLNNAISQMYAVAEVHNLLSHHTRETVSLHELVNGVCRALPALCPHRIEPVLDLDTQGLIVSASEAVPISLALNELIQNAVNHGYPDGKTGVIRVVLARHADGVALKVLNDGVAPPRHVDGVSGDGCGIGLSLVRALLPARGATFRLRRDGEWTVAELDFAFSVVYA